MTLSANQPAIEVRDLVAGYQRRIILDRISFSIPQGQIVTVLGGSGCGKSTLLKHIIGLLFQLFPGELLSPVGWWGRLRDSGPRLLQ